MRSLIVAIDSKGGIGKGNILPWHFSNDLKYFKQITTNNNIVMGYNTFLSIGKLLPNRNNIIITSKNINIDNAIVENNINCLEKYSDYFIIGGASIYKQVLEKNLVDYLYITHIDYDFNCDKFFPTDYLQIYNKIIINNIIYENNIKLTFCIYYK